MRPCGGTLAANLPEAVLHVRQVGEVVQVVGLYVEYDGYGRVEGEEAVVILAALEDDGVAPAHAVTRVQQRQSAAYHHGRVALGRHEYGACTCWWWSSCRGCRRCTARSHSRT